MPDENTYGFSRDDATTLLQGIGTGENWFPEIRPRGGGGRLKSVRFQIVSSDPTTFTGLAEVLAWDYGFVISDVHDLIIGSVVELCDPRACFLNEPSSDLIGRQGTAVYRQGVVDDICRPNGYVQPFPGVWEVETLCCQLISCDVVI